MLRIGLAQINSTVGDLRGNTNIIRNSIHQAKKQDVDLVIFPEMAVCGYPPEDLLYKKEFIRKNIQSMRSLKQCARGVSVLVGFVDQDTRGRLYNAAAFLHDGKIAGIYHKACLPNYGVFDERRYFTPGEENPVFCLGGYRIGVSICEDIWAEDGVIQKQARAAVGVLVNMSASPYDIGKLKNRRQILARAAKKLKAYVCYVNLFGGQDEIVFDGASCVFDPSGRRAASAKHFEEDLLVVDIDAPRVTRKASAREICLDMKPRERPAVAARKSKDLDKIERVYLGLVAGTRDYIFKNHFQKVVIGLSGGIDSSVVAAVAVDAVGAENVVGVSMPSVYSSTGTRADAKQIAGLLGIQFLEVPIQPIFQAYVDGMKACFSDRAPDVTEENIQARIRGNILMALSNKYGWLVLTTGNKSEMAVGYCTLYGDMSGGYAVIKDVYKTTVYELAEFYNRKAGREVIPRSVITRAPSAELRPDQTDQDSLPPYALLDQILIEYIEKHRGVSSIVKMLGHEDIVRKVLRLVDNSEYKRRQAPPGVKITSRAFGKDWRFPITNGYK